LCVRVRDGDKADEGAGGRRRQSVFAGRGHAVNELDRKLREALGTSEADLLGPLDEPTLWAQVGEMYRGRNGWLMWLVSVAIVAFGVFAVVSAVYFFHAESIREMIAWACGFNLGILAVTAGRLCCG
jgi:hypothetical protein